MKEWEKGTISSKTEIIPGYAFASTDFKKSGIPIIKIANVRLGSVDLADNSTQYVDEHLLNSLHPKYRVNSGDILISLTGSHLTQPNSVVGRVGRYRYQLTALVNQRAAKIEEVKGKSDKDFVYHLLSTHTLRKEIALLAHGAANQANVSHKDIEKIKVFWPPLPIQRKIAAVLSAYDDLIENNNRRIAILEKMAEELYREWFVRLRFPGHEKVRIVKGVPEGWEVKNLNKVSKNFDGKRIPLSSMEREKMRGSIPYFGAAKIIDYIDKYIFDGKYLLIAEDGSVVSDDGYPVLQFVNEKFWVNNHTHILQGIDEVFSTEWLYLSLLKYPINGLITGSAQPKITQANLNKIMLLTPKRDVLINFNSKVNPIIDLKIRLLISTNNLKTSRDRLLSRLMSGKIDVERLDIKFPASMMEEDNA